MKVLPLRWHGATRRERMRVALETLTKEWLSAWSGSDLAFECSLARDARMADDRTWIEAEAPCGSLLVAYTEQKLAQIGCLLAGVSLAQGHPVASGIGRRALKDFLELVIATLGGRASVKSISPVAESKLDPRHGVVSFQLRIEDVDVLIYADDRLCDLLAPSEHKRRNDLVPRLAAVKDEQIVLEATLDLGKLDLADFKRLRPGEVLKTQARLDEHAQLRHKNSQPIAAGLLVRRGGYRALKLESESNPRG